MFAGHYDKSQTIADSIPFDCLTEANQYLNNQSALGRYIIESIGAKEDYDAFKQAGISHYLLKVINFFDKSITVNPKLEVQQ